MNAEWVRKTCLAFPGATEEVVWGGDLTFKVAGKMFAHTVLEVAPVWLSFKASDENFVNLTERSNIIPAPYLARAKWVALETKDAVPLTELASLLRESYDQVVAKLPRKVQQSLAAAKPTLVSTGPTKRKSKRPAKRTNGRKKK
jgi:predicted DNA-binding protein (MmcQ/YjbR family)